VKLISTEYWKTFISTEMCLLVRVLVLGEEFF
jgi:hypothetical protein